MSQVPEHFQLPARPVAVAAVQMAMDWNASGNIARAEGLVRKAAGAGAQVILLPELFETPYFCIEQDSRHLALARELGAEVHCLQGSDFVQAILDFGREQRITQLFLGHSLRNPRTAFLHGPVDWLIDAADEFDVRIFPHRDAE